VKRPAIRPAANTPASDHAREPISARWLWILWAGIGLILAGEVLDVAWHARHGEFKSGADVVKGHWLGWLGLALTIAVCLAGARDHDRARRGYRSVLLASSVYVLGSVWNFWGHAHGEDTFFAHVFLVVSKVAILAMALFTTHLLIGRDEPGFSGVKKRAR
jgi:hypothetical protein